MAKRSNRSRENKSPPTATKRRRSSRRGADTGLSLPVMPVSNPPKPNKDELVRRFNKMLKANQVISDKHRRWKTKNVPEMDREKYDYYSQRFGVFLGKLIATPNNVVNFNIPAVLVCRQIVTDYPVRKTDSEKKQQQNRSKHRQQVQLTVNFSSISESKIPKWNGKKYIHVKAENNLTYGDLNLAMKVVGKNVDNVAVVLLLIYQYKSKMWDNTKIKILEKEDDIKNLHKLERILLYIDQVVESHLKNAKHLVRIAWTLASFANQKHDRFYNQSIREYREGQRKSYLEQLAKWKDSTNMSDDEKLNRCFFFHLAVIMSGSQGCKDEDGIERLHLLISGERTGSMSVCYPLRNCSFVEYMDFVGDVLKSGKSQGLDQLRVIAFIELAILCETVWKVKLPSNFRDLCRVPQIAQKKARVTLNGMGIINGVGVDDHVKKFMRKVLKLQYSDNELYSLLDQLDMKTATNVNDNIAEIGQKLNNVKRKGANWKEDEEWLSTLFHELNSISKEMEEICTNWLAIYDVSLN